MTRSVFGFVLTLKLNVQFEIVAPENFESNCSLFEDFLFKLYMLLLLAAGWNEFAIGIVEISLFC